VTEEFDGAADKIASGPTCDNERKDGAGGCTKMEDRMTRRPKKTPGAIDGIAAAAIRIDAEGIEAEAVRTGDFSKLALWSGGTSDQETPDPNAGQKGHHRRAQIRDEARAGELAGAGDK
jgi:hypothetical protein